MLHYVISIDSIVKGAVPSWFINGILSHKVSPIEGFFWYTPSWDYVK